MCENQIDATYMFRVMLDMPSQSYMSLTLGGFKTFYFSIVKSWRWAGIFFTPAGGRLGFFRLRKVQTSDPQPINCEPSLTYKMGDGLRSTPL